MKLVLLEKLFSTLGFGMMLDVWYGHLDTFAEKRRILSPQVLRAEMHFIYREKIFNYA